MVEDQEVSGSAGEIWLAVLDCPHTIFHDEIVIRVSHKRDGNAARQTFDRIETAVNSLIEKMAARIATLELERDAHAADAAHSFNRAYELKARLSEAVKVLKEIADENESSDVEGIRAFVKAFIATLGEKQE